MKSIFDLSLPAALNHPHVSHEIIEAITSRGPHLSVIIDCKYYCGSCIGHQLCNHIASGCPNCSSIKIKNHYCQVGDGPLYHTYECTMCGCISVGCGGGDICAAFLPVIDITQDDSI